jgi:F0F1-type ATP synthase assembly protein I
MSEEREQSAETAESAEPEWAGGEEAAPPGSSAAGHGDSERAERGRRSEEASGVESQQEATRKSGLAYAAGLALFFTVVTFMGLGWLLDRWLGTNWLLIAGIVFGAVVGFYEFIRIITKIR